MAFNALLILGLAASTLANLIPRQTVAPYAYGNGTTAVAPTVTGSSRSYPTGGLLRSNHTHSYCCFVIQDTVSIDFWAHYSTTTWYGPRRVISTISMITEYVDTTITNHKTITTVENATYLSTFQIGANGVNTFNHASYSPWTTTSMLNATATTIAGQAVSSPAGFYIYPSVKIINVPAITQSDGQLACRATSVFTQLCPVSGTGLKPRTSVSFTDINTHIAAYFSGQVGPTTQIQTYGNSTTVYHITRTATNTSAFRTTAEISFSTPFLFFPAKGRTEAIVEDPDVVIYGYSTTPTATPSITSTIRITSTISVTVGPSTISTTTSYPRITPTPTPVDIVNHDYGYIPQELIDWMAKDPGYVAQYPGLGSCLPGGEFASCVISMHLLTRSIGPSIDPIGGCVSVAAATATVVPDLITGSATTVKGVGCFHPGNCVAATNLPTSSNNNDNVLLAPFLGTPSKSSVATPSANESPIPVIKPTATPSSGLGAIIAGAFGGHPTSAAEETSANIPSNQVAGSETSAAGASPSSVSGSIISFAPTASAIPINGGTSGPQGPAVTANPAPVLTIGSQFITVNSASQYVVESQTLAPGSSAIVVSGSTYSLAPSASAIVVNGQTSSLAGGVAPSAVVPVISAGGQPITENSASQFVVGSQTLAPGSSAIVVSGTTYSLAPSGSAIVVNGVTSALSAYSPAGETAVNEAPIITFGTQPVIANSASQYVVGTQTLAPGSSAIIVSGTTYSLAPSASAVIVNGVTSVLPAIDSAAATNDASGGAPVITIGTQPVTENNASQYVIGTQTLAPGSSAIVVSGTTYSLAPSASAVVVNGVTSVLPANNPATATNDASGGAPVVTIGTQPFTASSVSGSDYVIGGQTLVPGASAITINGVEVSLTPSASDIVVGGTTEAFSAATSTASGTAFSPSAFTGEAPRIGIWLRGQILCIGLGLLAFVML